KEQWNFQCHGYCLMSNHYHLLIHTPNSGLSESMRHLSSMYTMRYNKKYLKDGPLFRGRFKSILLDRESSVLPILRCIHRNPVKAGLSKTVLTYRWSSHRAYMNKNEEPSFLYTNELLLDFAKSYSKARRKMHDFVLLGESKDFLHSIEGKHPVSMMGSGHFKDWVKNNFLEKVAKDRLIPATRNNKRPRINPKNMLLQVQSEFNISKQEILKSRVGSQPNIPKQAYLYLLHKIAGLTHAEIADIVKTGNKASVAQCIYRFVLKMEKEKELKERILCIKGNLLSNVKA
ncbi:MAG: transposase, partial [Pseudomonadota bacterium]